MSVCVCFLCLCVCVCVCLRNHIHKKAPLLWVCIHPSLVFLSSPLPFFFLIGDRTPDVSTAFTAESNQALPMALTHIPALAPCSVAQLALLLLLLLLAASRGDGDLGVAPAQGPNQCLHHIRHRQNRGRDRREGTSGNWVTVGNVASVSSMPAAGTICGT